MTTLGRRKRGTDPAAELLGSSARYLIDRALAHDPVATCMVADFVERIGTNSAAVGRNFLGAEGGERGMCFVAGNVIPIFGDQTALRSIAAALAPKQQQGIAILGRAELVLPLWESLQTTWTAPRDVRDDQPLLICPDSPTVKPDPQVCLVEPQHFDVYYPAAVAMFTEEVGVDPRLGDGGRGYRRRIEELIAQRRAFAIFDGDTVVFKAEIGSLSRRVGLIQGVWVHPDWRGRGIATAATAAVVAAVHRVGRLPSLYVNSFNEPARATYARLGFMQTATFASVLY